MANLFVEFTDAASSAPVVDAAECRSEEIVITESSDGDTVGTLAAEAGESILDIYAEESCYLAIGLNPVAEAPSASNRAVRRMAAGERRQFRVKVGYKVAVIGTA